MAQLADLARMYTDTVGQGTLTLTTAVPGFLSFANAEVPEGIAVSYAIETDYELFDGIPLPQSRERGRGIWTAATKQLTRASHIRSTGAAGVKLSLTGTSEVFITALADDFIALGGGTYQIKTSAGGVTVAVRDSLIILNKTVGEATAVTLPAAAGKIGGVWVKDLKGDAETNNITVSVSGGGTIDGAASYVMNRNKSARFFEPMPDGSAGYLILV